MAKIHIQGGSLHVLLSPLEKCLALRGNIRVPLTAVTACATLARPIPGVLFDLRLGFGAGGAPEKGYMTVGAWRCRSGDGKAFIAIYRNREAVVIELDDKKWRRIAVSMKNADQVKAAIRLCCS